MTEPSIATKIHQSLDVHRNFPAKVTFYLQVPVDEFPDLRDFTLGEIFRSRVRVDTCFSDNLLRSRPANAVDICQRNFDPFIFR